MNWENLLRMSIKWFMLFASRLACFAGIVWDNCWNQREVDFCHVTWKLTVSDKFSENRLHSAAIYQYFALECVWSDFISYPFLFHTHFHGSAKSHLNELEHFTVDDCTKYSRRVGCACVQKLRCKCERWHSSNCFEAIKSSGIIPICTSSSQLCFCTAWPSAWWMWTFWIILKSLELYIFKELPKKCQMIEWKSTDRRQMIKVLIIQTMISEMSKFLRCQFWS